MTGPKHDAMLALVREIIDGCTMRADLERMAREVLAMPNDRYRVVVEVRGGIAEGAECPPEVDLEIIDYDCLLEGKGEE